MTTTETFPLDVFQRPETRPSKIRPGGYCLARTVLICPCCNAENPPIEDGNCASCPDCGLHMAVKGNALVCSLED